MTFDAFTIVRTSDERTFPGTLWRVDSRNVEDLWLPTIGPAAYCMLRAFGNDQGDQVDITQPLTYRVDVLAERLGIRAKRVPHALRRLEEFRLIVRDAEWTVEHPLFVMAFRSVPELSDYRFDLLPVSVRARAGDD